MPQNNLNYQKPEGIRNARLLVRSIAAKIFRTEAALTVSQWADKNRKLTTKASTEKGDWQTSRTPYLREIMDSMSASHPCTDGHHMKGTQLGGTEVLLNVLGYGVDQMPCPAMLVMPTNDTAKKTSRQRVAPMIETTAVLRDNFTVRKSRESANTILLKDYPGGLWPFGGGQAHGPVRRTRKKVQDFNAENKRQVQNHAIL